MVCVSIISRIKPFFIGFAILALAILVVVTLHALKPKPEEEQSTRPPLSVKTAPVEFKQQKVFASFQGEVRAKTEIELVTQVSGKVVKVSDSFIEGGQFQPGETLIQIDDADYLVALKSAQANVASAQVELGRELATAETNAKQWQALQNKPISEANPLVLNKPQIDSARARLSAAEAQLAAAKLNYERTNISAPFAGRIMTKSAELGQFMPGGASIGRVFASDAMEIRIPMTDVQLDELGLRMGYSANSENSKGLPAKVSTRFGDQPQVWQAWLLSVDASVNSTTRLVFATIVVDNPLSIDTQSPAFLAPGLFVDVELASPEELSGLQVPRNALRNGEQVFVVADDKLQMRSVDVIFTSNDVALLNTADSATLKPGDLVIISPVPGAYSGMRVKVPEQATATQVEAPADNQSPG